jgi:hypothetical protein
MSVFELLSCVVLGVGTGFSLAGLAGWRSVGFARALALGALGGLVGGLVGVGTFPEGPVWGEMRFHPAAAAFAVAGGFSAVSLLRLLIGRPTLPDDQPFQKP